MQLTKEQTETFYTGLAAQASAAQALRALHPTMQAALAPFLAPPPIPFKPLLPARVQTGMLQRDYKQLVARERCEDQFGSDLYLMEDAIEQIQRAIKAHAMAGGLDGDAAKRLRNAIESIKGMSEWQP